MLVWNYPTGTTRATASRITPGVDDFDVDRFEALLARLTRHGDEGDSRLVEGSDVLYLWKLCGLFPNLLDALRSIDWETHPAETNQGFLDALLDRFYNRRSVHPNVAHAVPSALVKAALELQSIPAGHQKKFIRNLRYVFAYTLNDWYDKDVPRNLPAAIQLIAHACRPPYAPETTPADSLCALICCLNDAGLRRVEDNVHTYMPSIDKATKRRNDAYLIYCGTITLVHCIDDFVLESICRQPSAFIRIAKKFGLLPYEIRTQIIAQFKSHRIVTHDWQSSAPLDSLPIAELAISEQLPSPMSRSLREHLAGKRSLKERQIQRAVADMQKRVLAAQLSLLQKLADAEFESRVDGATEDETRRHAAALLLNVYDNRRALRRFLKANAAGDKDFVFRHPSSRAWLAAHPKLNEERWREGVTLERELPLHGKVSVGIEQNSLEALKLGTYVGSCLGLGGVHMEDAAAAVLDVNKQVVFARDAKGRVAARQLICVSEDDRLVCFRVYPEGSSKAIRNLMREFDELLASFLNLPIHSKRDGSYTIAEILSTNWHDDGSWSRGKHTRSPERTRHSFGST